MTPRIPLILDIDTGANNNTLNLTGLKVTSLDLDTGASETIMRFQAVAYSTRAVVGAGAAQLIMEIPPTIAAFIEGEVGLSSFEVDTQRFLRLGGGCKSADNDTADNKLYPRIEGGLASVTVR